MGVTENLLVCILGQIALFGKIRRLNSIFVPQNMVCVLLVAHKVM